jgi:hypothetical protein
VRAVKAPTLVQALRKISTVQAGRLILAMAVCERVVGRDSMEARSSCSLPIPKVLLLESGQSEYSHGSRRQAPSFFDGTTSLRNAPQLHFITYMLKNQRSASFGCIISLLATFTTR